MPTYDFKSNKTGEEWEDTMSWKDNAPVRPFA